MKSLLTILLLYTALIASSVAFAAAPPNDDICNATTLPVTGACPNLSGQTTISSTADYYGGCVQSTATSVWYTFTITSPNDMIEIRFSSYNTITQFQTFLFTGSCNSPMGVSTICDAPGTLFEFFNLTAGTTYWLLVATAPGNQDAFAICGSQKKKSSTTGPEQDCSGAIPVCSPTYVQGLSYSGYGAQQEVATSTCLQAGETNSMWYVFTVQTAGSLTFTITTTKDYDFALYNITMGGCASIPTSTPVRCNWSATPGNTGTDAPTSAETPALSENSMGTPFMDGITNVTAGNTYALIIDNWTGDQTGYSVTFGGTAVIVDATAPTMSSATPSCTDYTILVTMSENIQCLSVAQNDFILTLLPATNYTSAITSILGYNCPATDGAMTNQIQITHNGTLPSGQYKLEIAANPSLADKCGNAIAAGGFVNFNYLGNITMTASATALCNSGSVNFDANGVDGTPSLATYNFNPGGLTNNTNGQFNGITVSTTTTYTVSVTYGGCTKTASQTITIQGSVVVSISPIDPQVCTGGNVNLVATTTINGVACTDCDYSWNAGAYIENNVASSTWASRPVGTYTVQATTSAGCVSNIASSTISAASGSPGTCNVYYVTPSGSGSGLLKTDPASLSSALTSAQCSNSIIKMAVGVYTLTNRQMVTSYLTIEGGYAVNFLTKSSNMSGGNNSTTIRRKTNVDSDDANGYTAFRVGNNSSNFRFQDLRIELPGATPLVDNPAHAAGSGITNYGIRIGTGCSGYSIVRCYIDMGEGSDP